MLSAVNTPVNFQNGAILIELHSGPGSPVENVGSQNALNQGCEAIPGAHGIQLLQQVRQDSEGRSILPILVMAAVHSMSVITVSMS